MKADSSLLFAGDEAVVELHRTETTNYRDQFAISATGDSGSADHATLAGRGLVACNEFDERRELVGDHLFGWLVLEHAAFELGLSKPNEHFRRSKDGCVEERQRHPQVGLHA